MAFLGQSKGKGDATPHDDLPQEEIDGAGKRESQFPLTSLPMNAILYLIVLQFHESNGSDRVAALAQIRENMSYEYLRNLREKHAAWRLLTAD